MERRQRLGSLQLGFVFAAGDDEHVQRGVAAQHIVRDHAKTAARVYNVRSRGYQTRLKMGVAETSGSSENLIRSAEVEDLGALVDVDTDFHAAQPRRRSTYTAPVPPSFSRAEQ